MTDVLVVVDRTEDRLPRLNAGYERPGQQRIASGLHRADRNDIRRRLVLRRLGRRESDSNGLGIEDDVARFSSRNEAPAPIIGSSSPNMSRTIKFVD